MSGSTFPNAKETILDPLLSAPGALKITSAVGKAAALMLPLPVPTACLLNVAVIVVFPVILVPELTDQPSNE